MDILRIIFGALCALLYVIGLVLGLDYEEVSVLLCIDVLPWVFVVASSLVTISAFIRWAKRMSVITSVNLIVSSWVSSLMLLISSMFNDMYYKAYQDAVPLSTTHDRFVACQNDLLWIAKQTGMTYQAVNLLIYVVIPILLLAVFWVWLELSCNRRLLLNRLWKKNKVVTDQPF